MRKFIVDFDPTFYRGIADREGAWRHQQSLTVPAFEGGAIEVGRGQVLRISNPTVRRSVISTRFPPPTPRNISGPGVRASSRMRI